LVSLDYVAGFFDGEGSVVVRFVRDGRYRAGYRVSTKVVFVQKERGGCSRRSVRRSGWGTCTVGATACGTSRSTVGRTCVGSWI